MPDIGVVALLAMASCPVACWFIFKKLPMSQATITAILFATFYLPAGGRAVFDFPAVPPLGKGGIAIVSTAFCLFIFHGKKLRKAKPLRGVEMIALLASFGVIGTYFQNQEVLVYGTLSGVAPEANLAVLPPMNSRDIVSNIVRDVLEIITPFIIGRFAFQSRKDMRVLFTAFLAFGLTYIPLVLLELRISPTLHTKLYGYYPHDFSQAYRWGGWRPQVFFDHGLTHARAQFMAFLSATALYLGREKKAWRFDPKTVVWVTAVMVVLCKTMGVVVYLIAFGLLYYATALKTRLRVLVIVALLVSSYPFVRAFNIVDIDAVIDRIETIAPERAQSLAYRFRNERELSNRAREKLWFGWFGYGRAHVWDEEYGRDLTVTDGYWVIRFSELGVIGLIGPFALLLLPVLRTARDIRKIPWKSDQIMVSVMAGMSLVFAIEALPNAYATVLPFLIAGATWGVASKLSDPKYIRAEQRRQAMRGRPPGPPPGAPFPAAPTGPRTRRPLERS